MNYTSTAVFPAAVSAVSAATFCAAYAAANRWAGENYEVWDHLKIMFSCHLGKEDKKEVFDAFEGVVTFPLKRFKWGFNYRGEEVKEHYVTSYWRNGNVDHYHYGWVF